MRTISILLAASLALSSASALASKTTKTEDKQADAATATAPAASLDAKVCLDQTPSTGSRIYTHECRTKSEWAKRGVDIDELRKQQ